MNLYDGIAQAYNRKWSFINTFKVQFLFADRLKEVSGWEDEDDTLIQLNIISIDTPQLTNQPYEIFQADEWRIHNGRDELYRFTVTFRDESQLKYYKKFVSMYTDSKLSYFDDIKSMILLYKEADWKGEDDTVLYTYENVLIENVSQIQFNNTTENQVAEFSVGFKFTKKHISV